MLIALQTFTCWLAKVLIPLALYMCRSGTEEEYSERDHILQDLICLAEGTSFTFKVRVHRRIRKAPPLGA